MIDLRCGPDPGDIEITNAAAQPASAIFDACSAVASFAGMWLLCRCRAAMLVFAFSARWRSFGAEFATEASAQSSLVVRDGRLCRLWAFLIPEGLETARPLPWSMARAGGVRAMAIVFPCSGILFRESSLELWSRMLGFLRRCAMIHETQEVGAALAVGGTLLTT